jgi:hypothetical protein
VKDDVLRVANQSKRVGEVLFRDSAIRLDPGQIVDLALLSAGGRPIQVDSGQKVVEGAGYPVRWTGSVEAERDGTAVRVRALGENEIQANGVLVRLEKDEVVRFESLGSRP